MTDGSRNVGNNQGNGGNKTGVSNMNVENMGGNNSGDNARNIDDGSTKSTASEKVDWSINRNVDSCEVLLGGTHPTSRGGVNVGVSTATGGLKLKGGPASRPSWWGVGLCVDYVTIESFIRSRDGIPLLI